MEGFLQYRRLVQSTRHEFEDTDPVQCSSSDDKEVEQTVKFREIDPNEPRQWSLSWKVFYTIIIWLLVFVTGWASSADSTSHEIAAKALHVTEVVESLSTSTYLFGVALGAVIAGPCSETIGRLATYLGTFSIYLIWVMASALAPNFGAQCAFRGLAGLFASASMSIYGGSLADMYDVETRAFVWPLFSLSPLLGPTIAPIANGWISQNLGFRWDDWITLIISAFSFLLAVAFLPETYAPIILSFKAAELRRITGRQDIKSEYEQGSKLSTMLLNNLRRICHFIFREGTTLLFGFYLTLLYVLIFGFLEGFDFIFTQTYRFDIGQRYSAFAAISLGMLAALPYVMIVNHFCTRARDGKVYPEQRLVPALFAAPLLTASLFWIGWTTRKSVSYYSDMGACFLFGFALLALFTTTYHYLLDAYGTVASSALAAITFMRYIASGGMVVATEPLYYALTVKWVLTLLGGLAALLTPVPWIFWKYGSSIRARSKWTQ